MVARYLWHEGRHSILLATEATCRYSSAACSAFPLIKLRDAYSHSDSHAVTTCTCTCMHHVVLSHLGCQFDYTALLWLQTYYIKSEWSWQFVTTTCRPAYSLIVMVTMSSFLILHWQNFTLQVVPGYRRSQYLSLARSRHKRPERAKESCWPRGSSTYSHWLYIRQCIHNMPTKPVHWGIYFARQLFILD